MRLYRVTTTFLGADGPAIVYYNTRVKARRFLNKCDNGEITIVNVTANYPLNYSDGCTMNDLTYGDFNAVETEVEYEPFEETVTTIREADTWDEVLPELQFIMEEAGLSYEWQHADGDTFEDVIRKAQEKLNIDLGL